MENSALPTLSILVPVYNEREVLPLAFERISQVMAATGLSYEVVFVDDGSRDGSSLYLVQLASEHANICSVQLSRNFGKEAAMSAGLHYCRGEATVILDADLQDPPELIGQMVEAWRAGADVVAMRRKNRLGETWPKRASAHVYYRVLNYLSDINIPADIGDFRLISARVVKALCALPERVRYMKGLFAWVGYPTTVIDYVRDPRAAGQTKWNYFRLLAFAWEGICAFSVRPLRWVSGVGLLSALAGLVYGAVIVLEALVMGNPVPGYPSLIAFIIFLGGTQLIATGILGEYVGKTYLESKQRPVFLVERVVRSEASSAS